MISTIKTLGALLTVFASIVCVNPVATSEITNPWTRHAVSTQSEYLMVAKVGDDSRAATLKKLQRAANIWRQRQQLKPITLQQVESRILEKDGKLYYSAAGPRVQIRYAHNYPSELAALSDETIEVRNRKIIKMDWSSGNSLKWVDKLNQYPAELADLPRLSD